jgi:hypothetical protein
MELEALGYADFITTDLRQPSPSRDAALGLDLAALADAERADAEAFRLA